MKKFFVIFALFCAMVLMIGCSGGSKNDNKKDNSDSGETVTDSDTADDSEPADDSDSNSDSDISDTGIPGSDDDSDSTPAQSDDEDSLPDDDSDTEPEPVFNECNESHTFPCYDPEHKLYWSEKTTVNNIEAGISHCKYKVTEGLSGWYLPTISELRTLVKNCDKIAPNGICPIVDETSAMESFNDCRCDGAENYSKFGDTDELFSATQPDPDHVWEINFESGELADERDTGGTIRCAATALSPKCTKELCSNIEFSTGECDDSNTEYYGKIACGCKSGYTWNGSYCYIPECGKNTTSFPCKDSDTGYIWSEKTPNISWQQATDLCDDLNTSNYGGFNSGWHLPTINELRTLIQDNPATQMPPSGSDVCPIRNDEGNVCLVESCWTESACCSGSYDSNGGHSKFGETDSLWSSSLITDYSDGAAWYVNFHHGCVYGSTISRINYVRCVR